MHELKVHSTDEGFCRINYTLKKGSRTYHFCLQDEGDFGVIAYNCYSDWFEPGSPINTDNCNFELPVGDTDLIRTIYNAILEMNKNKGVA